jgi:hypothetical protein
VPKRATTRALIIMRICRGFASVRLRIQRRSDITRHGRQSESAIRVVRRPSPLAANRWSDRRSVEAHLLALAVVDGPATGKGRNPRDASLDPE